MADEEQQTVIDDNQQDEVPGALNMIYCGVCTFPPEFGPSFTKCKEWLQQAHPDMFNSLYSAEALEEKTANLTISEEQEAKISKDAAKKEAKQAAKQSKLEAEKAGVKVVLKRIERGKRKYVTAIANLQTFPGVEIKAASKKLAQRFATGASVTKTAEGKEEIVVQGDLVDDIEEFLIEKYNIPEDKIVIREEKAKK